MVIAISSCQEMKQKDSHIPWYISERIKTGLIENYNYLDSFKKYKTLKKGEIFNRDKYKSYLIDLEFKIEEKSNEELQIELKKLIEAKPKDYCEKLIKPALEYISPQNRPDRRYSKPYIIGLDFDYFIKKCIECKYIKDSLNINYEIGKLKLSHIMLKDQWFRIPGRLEMPDIQEQYDLENSQELDQLYISNKLNLQDGKIRSSIYILLLHSTDCEWTKKWLKIYFGNCSNYSEYKQNLNHFLWRSSCKNDEIVNMVENEIKKH